MRSTVTFPKLAVRSRKQRTRQSMYKDAASTGRHSQSVSLKEDMREYLEA
jgi:hypothetical protein